MSSIATSIESFVLDLKKNPRLAYRKFRNRVLLETKASCNEITENYGLLFFLLPLAEWLALPGNSGPGPNGGIINIGGYDINGIIEAPAADAAGVQSWPQGDGANDGFKGGLGVVDITLAQLQTRQARQARGVGAEGRLAGPERLVGVGGCAH